MNILENYLLEIQELGAHLVDFDYSFYNKIPDKNNILYDKKNGKYFTIMVGKNKAGIIGVIIRKRALGQILIIPKYKGKNLLSISYNLISKKLSLKKIYASIKKSNIESIKGHLKAGFKKISKKEEDKYRSLGIIPEENIWLYKEFK